MSSHNESLTGDYSIHTNGDVTLNAEGANMLLCASSIDGNVNVAAGSAVNLASGGASLSVCEQDEVGGTVLVCGSEIGSIRMSVGLPVVGSQMEMGPEEITLTVGPPGVGASITMGPEEIIFRVAETEFRMTPLGISESVMECQREHTAVGHELLAGETSVSYTLEGELKDLPLQTSSVEGGSVIEETIGDHSTSALKNIEASVLMTE